MEDDLDGSKFKKQLKVFESKDHDLTAVIVSMNTLRTLIGKEPTRYQEAILEEENNIFEVSHKIIQCYNTNKEGKIGVEQLCILWQFLHNLCVGQRSFTQKLWNNIGQTIYDLIKCEGDAKLRNLLSAVILQTLKNNISFEDHPTKTPEITKAVLQVIVEDENGQLDFPLLVVQEILRNQTGFCLQTIYVELNLSQRCVLLDIISEEKLEALDRRVVQLLVSTFKKQSTILMTILEKRENVAEPREVSKVVNILGCVSHLDEFRLLLQNDTSFLIDVVYLLRIIQDVGKEHKSHMFSSVKNMDEIANREKMEEDPVFGFKRDLIRLIGNLCYEHKQNQDQVREISGIVLLLDCSPIDGKNPFISQWVVFAIRNVCSGNHENQAVLNSISKTGKMDKKLLEEVGVQIENM